MGVDCPSEDANVAEEVLAVSPFSDEDDDDKDMCKICHGGRSESALISPCRYQLIIIWRALHLVTFVG